MIEGISEIVPAMPDDLDEIVSLVNMTNTEWYEPIIPPEYWYEPFLSREQFEEMSTVMDFFIQRYNDEIVSVGSLGIRKDGTDWITLMTVHTNFQRRRIRSSLLQYLECLAIEH